MAKKPDIAAAKARKQKIILAVAGVALIGVAVIQVPKLMKGAAASLRPLRRPRRAATDVAAPRPAPAVVVNSTTGTFEAGGVRGRRGTAGRDTVVVAKSQLASFTLFEAKDPFVQQVGDETGAGRPRRSAPTSAEPHPAPAASRPRQLTPERARPPRRRRSSTRPSCSTASPSSCR